MQSPVRPEHSTDKAAVAAEASAPEVRAAGRRDVRPGAASAAALKLLDRRSPAAAAAEAAPRRAPEARREEAPRPPAPRPANPPPEHRRATEPTSFGARLGVTAARRVHFLLVAVAVVAFGVTWWLELPAVAVAAALGLCLIGGAVVSHLTANALLELTQSARAISRGDYTTRAPVGTGELGDLARAFNTLVDERASQTTQSSDQQQRLQSDIHQLSSVLAALAAGDPTPPAQVHGGSLAKLASEVNGAVEEMHRLEGASRHASRAIQAQVDGARQLALQGSEVHTRLTTAIEEAAKQARAVAERNAGVAQSAQLAAVAVRRTAEGAQEGGRTAHGLREAMLDLRREAQGALARIQRLAGHGSEASGTVGTLSRVSAQANLLALNAAIEASRAGAHGFGFGLIADEVRKLAEDCEEATGALQRIVAEVLAAAGEAGADLERQGSRMERLAQTAAQAGEMMDRIAAAGQQGTGLVGEIMRTAQDEAAEAEKLEEAILGAVQRGREIQAGAERSRQNLEAIDVAVQELARRLPATEDDPGEEPSR